MISPYLTVAGHRMLKALRDGEDHYAIVDGVQVWVDYTRFSRRTLNVLLRYCLIRCDSFSSEKIQTYYLNEEGKQIIDDPAYEPMILQAMKGADDGTVTR